MFTVARTGMYISKSSYTDMVHSDLEGVNNEYVLTTNHKIIPRVMNDLNVSISFSRSLCFT